MTPLREGDAMKLKSPREVECYEEGVNDERMRCASLLQFHDRLVAALRQAARVLGEACEIISVLEDNGGHDGLQGKALLATVDHIDDAGRAIMGLLMDVEARDEGRPR